MMKRKVLAILSILALAMFSFGGAAMAQESSDAPAADAPLKRTNPRLNQNPWQTIGEPAA